MNLTTDRLHIRDFFISDTQDVLEVYSSPELQKYIDRNILTTTEEAKDLIKRYQGPHPFDRKLGVFAVVECSSNKVIGTALIVPLRDSEGNFLDEIEVGYHINKEYWNQGYATEVSKGLIKYGLDEVGLSEVFAVVLSDNASSIRVLEKSGMCSEGETSQYYGEKLLKYKAARNNLNTEENSFVNKKLRLISKHLLHLKIKSIEHDDSGQNNDIVVVNDELVFRFPKHKKELEIVKKEIDTLQRISGSLPLLVPAPIVPINICIDYPLGEWFSYYHKISGSPLTSKEYNNFLDKELLAKQLASFLKALHNITGKDMLVTIVDSYEIWQGFYNKVSQQLFQYMNADAIQSFTNRYNSFKEEFFQDSFQSALVHGDFGPTNILHDSDGITGIIDFGSMHIGDPATDIASLMGPFGYGEQFVKKMEIYYPEINAYLQRAKFYASTFALQEALFGIEHGDEEAFNAGIKDFR